MKFKWWLFRNYLWVGLLVGIVVAMLIWMLTLPGEAAVAGVAAIFSFFYFVQRQRLEETRLFKELFTEFNRRYDRLNDRLAAIHKGNALDAAMEARFIDYFNLCAEEFLFYCHGYIYQEVWKSWCRGMLQYLRIPCVRELWNREATTGSYYDLTYEEIEQGAA